MTVKICRCGAKFALVDATIKPAPAKFQTYVDERLGYYCGLCSGFHHVIQEETSVVRGPLDARALLHASVKQNGQHLMTWAVGSLDNPARTTVETVEFFPWPRRYRMTETEPLIHLTWQLLMSKVAVIMGDPEATKHLVTNGEMADGQLQAKFQARGIAEVLAIQMKPFMESADHVVKCAVAAYKDPEFEVPGLGKHLWDPMKNPDGSDRVPVTTRAAAKKASPARTIRTVDNTSTKKLTDKEVDGIKEAIGSGMFSEEDIASMFKVSLATVKEAVGA